jgi:dihydroflavonol-4-reductase
MPILVTGASGHVGANLVRALLAQGQQVRALVHHDRRALEGLDVEIVEGDICQPDSLERAVAGADLVYHTAAYISLRTDDWLLSRYVNVHGTRNVVEACLRAGVRRLVHFSSIHALDHESQSGTIDETCPLVDDHCPPYDRSKAAGEREVQAGIAQGLDAIIIRPTAVIGPYDFRPSHLGQVLLSLAQGTMPALVTGGFDWVDVRDVVKGALRAVERAPSGASYLLSGHWVSVVDLAATAADITGRPAPRFVCPLPLARVGAPFATAFAWLTGTRPLFTSVSLRALRLTSPVSHDRAGRELGYEPRPFADTIADTLAWFREQGLF